MSTNSRWWFLDLTLALVLTVVGGLASYLQIGGRLQVVLVLPLVVFLPGYVLISALFPEGGENGSQTFGTNENDAAYAVGGPERVALAAALSVAVVPMIAALSNFTPWGVRVHPILYGIVGFTVIVGCIAFIRRMDVPAERRYSPGLPNLLFSSSGRRSGGELTMMLNVGLVISFLLLASSVGFAVFNPPQGETFTEFYVNTNDVNSNTNTLYQTNLATDGVTVNVNNHEGERVQYTVVAVIQQVEDGSVTRESQLAKKQVTVDSGAKKQVNLTGDPAFTGDNVRVRFLLYKGSASGQPYITARAWVSSGSAPNQSALDDENQGSDGDEQTSEQLTTRRQTSEEQTEQQTTTQPLTTSSTSQVSSTTTTQPPSTTTTSSTTSSGRTTTSNTGTTATTTSTTTDDGGLFP